MTDPIQYWNARMAADVTAKRIAAAAVEQMKKELAAMGLEAEGVEGKCSFEIDELGEPPPHVVATALLDPRVAAGTHVVQYFAEHLDGRPNPHPLRVRVCRGGVAGDGVLEVQTYQGWWRPWAPMFDDFARPATVEPMP